MATELDSPFPLPADAIKRFEDGGFVKLKGVLSADAIAEYEPEITGRVIDLNTMHLPIEERDTYHKAFLQVQNLWTHSPLVREFAFSKRLARLAAELLGVSGVRLYHDQALYKEAGGGFTPWHADQYYWPLSSDRSITVWVPLQETPKDMGPLSFAVGSHHFEFGRDMVISDESEKQLQKALAAQNFPVVDDAYELGEVSYHLGWTFHRAEPNHTPTPRRVMTVIYVDADITVAEPVNENQRASLHFPLGDARPGDRLSDVTNPVLYRDDDGE